MRTWMLGVLLTLPFGIGAQAEAKVPAKPVAEAGEVEWPLPWQDGLKLVYADTYERTTHRSGVEVVMRSASTTRIDTVPTNEGFIQHWVAENVVMEVEGMEGGSGGLDMAAIMTTAGKAFEGVAMETRLDEKGAYVGIANLDEMAIVMRGVMSKMFDDMRKGMETAGAAIDDGMWTSLVDGMLAQMASSDAIEGSLSEQPHVYNFMAGGGLVPGETYLFQDEGVLPIADMVVARQNRLHVVQDADEPGKYDAHWIVELDKDAVRDALAAAVEQMVAGVPEMRGKGVDSLAGDIEVITRVDYHIDAATGVVERLRMVTTKTFSDRRDVETREMVLTGMSGP